MPKIYISLLVIVIEHTLIVNSIISLNVKLKNNFSFRSSFLTPNLFDLWSNKTIDHIELDVKLIFKGNRTFSEEIYHPRCSFVSYAPRDYNCTDYAPKGCRIIREIEIESSNLFGIDKKFCWGVKTFSLKIYELKNIIIFTHFNEFFTVNTENVYWVTKYVDNKRHYITIPKFDLSKNFSIKYQIHDDFARVINTSPWYLYDLLQKNHDNTNISEWKVKFGGLYPFEMQTTLLRS